MEAKVHTTIFWKQLNNLLWLNIYALLSILIPYTGQTVMDDETIFDGFASCSSVLDLKIILSFFILLLVSCFIITYCMHSIEKSNKSSSTDLALIIYNLEIVLCVPFKKGFG